MTDKKKAAELLQFMEDEWDGKAIINALNPLLKDDDLALLYDRLIADGVIRTEPDETDTEEAINLPEELHDVIRYVRREMNPLDRRQLTLDIEKAYDRHLSPTNCTLLDEKVIDLLEEYGDDNDLPEGWWQNYADIDDILFNI